MLQSEGFSREVESSLREIADRFREELKAIRSNRPSVELMEHIKFELYGQPIAVNQAGSLSIRPPREIIINVWDKNAVNPMVKAIEEAKVGMSVSTDGNVIRASLPALTDERREELAKLAKKAAEASRIQIRNHRDEQIKKLKAAEEKKEISEDELFKLKEKIQKMVDVANQNVERALEGKLKEINE